MQTIKVKNVRAIIHSNENLIMKNQRQFDLLFPTFSAILCYAIKAFTINVIHETLNKKIYVTLICLEKTLRTVICTKGTLDGASSISSLNKIYKISSKSLWALAHRSVASIVDHVHPSSKFIPYSTIHR